MERNVRLVYTTERGRICEGCGMAIGECTCRKAKAEEPLPARMVARVRIAKKGRGGKTVTVISDLPRNHAFLQELCQDLKRACGTGGAVVDGGVEIQGDLRDRAREMLTARGIVVKG